MVKIKNCEIDDDAIIDRLTVIGNNCYVGKGVHVKRSLLLNDISIRKGTYIEDNSIICSRVDIGENTRSRRIYLSCQCILSGLVKAENVRRNGGGNRSQKRERGVYPQKADQKRRVSHGLGFG